MQQPLRFQLGEPARDLGRRIMTQAVLQQVRVRLAVDQAENAALFGRHARIARLPRFLACLGTLIDPIRCRHAPSPESPFTPLHIGPPPPRRKARRNHLTEPPAAKSRRAPGSRTPGCGRREKSSPPPPGGY